MEHFKKLMEKKKKEGSAMLHPMEAMARGSVLHHLMGSLDEDGAKKVKGLKKVTVASNSVPGVKEGLDIAKKTLDQGEKEIHGGDQGDNDLLKHELSKSPEYDDNESEEAMDDSPENHEGMAEANDPMSMHGKMQKFAEGGEVESPEMAEESPEHEEYTDPSEHIEKLSQENEHLKMLIQKMREPKPFY